MSSIVILFFVVLMELIALGMMIPLIPYTARSFGADDLQVGLLMSIYSILQCVVSPLWGQWSDNRGKKTTLVLSLSFTALSYLWFAFAPNLVHLFLSRALAGAFGVTVPTAFALMSSWTGSKERSKYIGLIGACFGLGFVIGPSLGGAIGLINFSLPFFPVAVCASLTCAIGLGIAYFKIKKDQVNILKRPKPASKSIFVFHSYIKSIGKTISQLTIALQDTKLRTLLVLFFALSLSLTLVEAPLFLFMKDQFKWSSSMSSFGFAYIGIILAFTQGFLVRHFIPQWGERNLMVWNFFIMTFGFLGLCFTEIRLIALAVTLMSLGHAFCYTCLTGGISLLSKINHQGKVLGIHQSLSSLSRIIGPAVGGFLYRDISHSAPFIVAGVISGVSFLFSVLYRKRIPNAGHIEKKLTNDDSSFTDEDREYIEVRMDQALDIIQKQIPCSFYNISTQGDLKTKTDIDLILEKCQNKEESELLTKEFSKDHPVIIVCEDGKRSGVLALNLSKKYKNIYYLKGGFLNKGNE